MVIRYTLTRWDLFKAGIWISFSSRISWGVYAILCAWLAYSAYSKASAASFGFGLQTLVVVLVLVLFVVVIIGLVALPSLIRAFTTRPQGILGEHSLRVTDEGLVESTAYNQSLNRWASFIGCKKRGGLLFVYVADGMAHVVPMQRPMLEGEIAAFREAIQAQLLRVQSSTSVDSTKGPL